MYLRNSSSSSLARPRLDRLNTQYPPHTHNQKEKVIYADNAGEFNEACHEDDVYNEPEDS